MDAYPELTTGAAGVGLTAISMAMAFSVKSHGDFFSVLGFLSLPMIFLSSALILFASGALGELVYKLGDVREREFAKLTQK